ncbi:hypothetical protein ACWD04_16180 [Streptomyces sp. NPDC002911]
MPAIIESVNSALSRVLGVLVMLLGIAVVLWVVFGDPQGWRGGMRLLRFALVVSSLGVIVCSTSLIFPGDRAAATENADG